MTLAELLMLVLFVLPTTLEVLSLARDEREAMRQQQADLEASRARARTAAALAELDAAKARRAQQENLKLADELNRKLREQK